MKQSLVFVFLIGCASSFAQYKYPATKTVDSTDTYFGVTYKDPYRWLEFIKQPEVESVTYSNFADQFAFVMWQCGHKDFQLKK